MSTEKEIITLKNELAELKAKAQLENWLRANHIFKETKINYNFWDWLFFL